MNTPDNLPQLFQDIWTTLNEACHDREHPWKLPIVSNAVFKCNRTVSEQRIVVLRGCDDAFFRLFFHTDSRSAKYQQLQDNSHLHWLFWDPKHRIQLRVQSLVTLHHQNERSEKDELTPSRRKRVAQGSGTKIEDINKLVKSFKQAKQFFKNMPNMKQLEKMLGGSLWR